MPTFILNRKLLKARVKEPSMTSLCSDKILHLTHLLLNSKQLTFYLNMYFRKFSNLDFGASQDIKAPPVFLSAYYRH